MRNTKQRDLIYSIVNNSNEHLDAYHIYELCRKEIPNISLGTVYRNLSNLIEAKKIIKIKVLGFDRYDKNINHSHFICDKCNCIIDVFDNNCYLNSIVDGNLVTDYEIKYKGICKKCMEGNDN
ncbi:MAG: transcriptional repressor [Bacilli bacterium]|nr:transcriptional repressor [Bacilli bacterium]